MGFLSSASRPPGPLIREPWPAMRWDGVGLLAPDGSQMEALEDPCAVHPHPSRPARQGSPSSVELSPAHRASCCTPSFKPLMQLGGIVVGQACLPFFVLRGRRWRHVSAIYTVHLLRHPGGVCVCCWRWVVVGSRGRTDICCQTPRPVGVGHDVGLATNHWPTSAADTVDCASDVGDFCRHGS